MDRLGYGGEAHKARLVGVIGAMMVLAAAHTAHAQTSAPAAVNAIDQAPSEAARRAALSPYRFILQNATAPVRKPAPAAPAAAPAPAPSPAPAVAEPKKPSAPPQTQQAAAQPTAASAAKPAVADAPASAAASAAEAIASLSRQPTEPLAPPPRLEIIPVRTDEPRLPTALLRERPSGVVKVHFDIQPDGSVSDVKVTSSSNRSLNRPSIDAVQKWKFEPVDAVLTVETELVYKFDQ